MNNKVIFLEKEEDRISQANKIEVIEELVKDGIISEKEGFKIKKKLVTD